MSLTSKSRVVSAAGTGPLRPEVRRARTPGTLGAPSNRGADATVARNRRAWRPAAALLAVALLAGAAGCDYRESGNGKYHEERIHPAEFTGVWTEDGIDAVITITSTATQAVTLTGDENIVNENFEWAVTQQTVGETSVPVLHVWASRSFTPVIPARVVITRPSLLLARGSDGVDLQITGTPGWTAPGPLHAALHGATLSAGDYAVDGAVVDLDLGSTAVLRAEGPVVGAVSADSHLDNTRGVGSCAGVVTSGAGNVRCN